MLAFLAVSITGCTQTVIPADDGGKKTSQQKVDDWVYDPAKYQDEEGYFGRTFSKTTGAGAPQMAMEAMAPVSAGSNLGFSVGGAKDVGNFRENIKNNFLPLPTDITYEGLFYGYFFDTGQQEECANLFCPSYVTAISADPLNDEKEYYLSVGLNSGMKEADFQRKKLNLIIVLDVSGSMGSNFDKYYYDRFGNQTEREDFEESGLSKMEIANNSVVALLDHLNDDDKFGMVLFDDYSYLAKPLTEVGGVDMDKIKDHILDIQDQGGTNMESGMKEGTSLLTEISDANPDEYENRVIFITDAMPNLGDTSDESLLGMLENNAKDNIYTTFIGVGVDFNTQLVEALTKISGANYYSVHSEKEFKETMDDGFDYMVTPLVFDLELKLEADGYEIEKVYGSPEADEATGEIMKVNTLFPSKTEEGRVKGGIVLLKLNKTSQDGNLTLEVTYEDRNGQENSDQKEITFEDKNEDYYDNLGIRKAIALTRYVSLMKAWAMEGHANANRAKPLPVPCPIITFERGIYPPEPPFMPPCFIELGEWERQSVPLSVDSEYRKIFTQFAEYFKAEVLATRDRDLDQESEILSKLLES